MDIPRRTKAAPDVPLESQQPRARGAVRCVAATPTIAGRLSRACICPDAKERTAALSCHRGEDRLHSRRLPRNS